MVMVVAIIEVKVIKKNIIIDLMMVIRTIKKGKMKKEHLPNIIIKKILVTNVECLVIFRYNVALSDIV